MKLSLVLCMSATPFANATLKSSWTPPQRFEQWPSLIDFPEFEGKSDTSPFSPRNSAASRLIVHAMRSRVMMELRGGDDADLEATSSDKKTQGERKRAKKRRRSARPKDVEVTVAPVEEHASPENALDSSTPRNDGGKESSTGEVNNDSKTKKKRRRNFMSNMFSKSAADSLDIDSQRRHSACEEMASINGSPHKQNASLDHSHEPSNPKRRQKRRRTQSKKMLIPPQEESESQVTDSSASQAFLQNIDEDKEEDNLNKSSAESIIKKRKRRHRKKSPSVESSLPSAARKTTIDLVDHDMHAEDIEMDMLGAKNDQPLAEKKRRRKRRKRKAEGDATQLEGAADLATQPDSKINEKQFTHLDDRSTEIETLSSPTVSSDTAVENAIDEDVPESILSLSKVDDSLTGPGESFESQDGALIESTLEGQVESSKVIESSTEVRVEDIFPEGVIFTVEDEALKSGDLTSETLSVDTLLDGSNEALVQEGTLSTVESEESLNVLGTKEEDVIGDGSSVEDIWSGKYPENGDQRNEENNFGVAEKTQAIPLLSGNELHRDEPAEEGKAQTIQSVTEDNSTTLSDDVSNDSRDYQEVEEQLEGGTDTNYEVKTLYEIVDSSNVADTSDAKKADMRIDEATVEKYVIPENEHMSEGSNENVAEEGCVVSASVNTSVGPSLHAMVPGSLPSYVEPTDELIKDQNVSDTVKSTSLTDADKSTPDLTRDDKPAESTVKPKNSIEDSVMAHTEESGRKRDEDLLVLSIVTWNLGEAAPPEKEASFIRKFRTINSSFHARKRGSDLVMIGAQECEDIKPRRSEGHRSRHLRRLGIQMLGEQYVPIAMHSLGGIQMALYCHRDKLGDVEMVNIADVTCGVGNVFHNKGAIGVYLKMKHRGSGSEGAIKSSRILLVTGHLAAHVKNVDSRNDDFRRILTELETQAPARFLRPQKNSDGSLVSGDGSHLLNSVDHVFFSGDLNYRIDLPREYVDRCIDDINKCLLKVSSDPDQCKTAESKKIAFLLNKLLRRDQLLQMIASGRAFSQFNEGEISFLPTFKFDKGSPDYDTSYKQRVPAWTDRIVFKSNSIRVIEYDSVPQAMHSDHRPVYGTFQLGWGSLKSLTRSKRK